VQAYPKPMKNYGFSKKIKVLAPPQGVGYK
jgi:hypothetical protein